MICVIVYDGHCLYTRDMCDSSRWSLSVLQQLGDDDADYNDDDDDNDNAGRDVDADDDYVYDLV